MFSGEGLGYFNTTRTGINYGGALQCVTAAEKAEADSKCYLGTLRGLGAETNITRILSPMSGRLAGISPCGVRLMPVCPTPSCLDEAATMAIVNCMTGNNASSDIDCPSLVDSLSHVPFCSRPSVLPPIPGCADPTFQSLRSYCKQYGSDGPNGPKNAICWLARNDANYWNQVVNLPNCAAAAPPPVIRELPHPPTPAPVPPPIFEPTPHGGGGGESGTIGIGGILAILAAAGGGYYLYRRYKR